MTGMVAKLSRTPGAIHCTGPEVGQDSRDVLRRQLGLPHEQIDLLVQQGIVKTTTSVERQS